ncbi:MAG: hypothetical protein HY683_02270 [Chloroflexi bacterium]|nr:hypothetical protein [Chloroflexota bacterium]
MADSHTEAAWKRLFERLPIAGALATDGVFYITADQIKRLSGREPRLMTKFDTRAARPAILGRNNITILPVTNGKYALVSGDGYHNFEPAGAPVSRETTLNKTIETLPWEAGCSSESQVLDTAHATALLGHFTGERRLLLTIRGRLRSPGFSFRFDSGPHSLRLQVDGVQIEVDGGYEGGKVHLFEAKMGQRDDFLIRQLYYPFRMWSEAGIHKEIIPILVTYSNKVFSFRSYRFTDRDSYDSLVFTRGADFILGPLEERPSLEAILSQTKARRLPAGIPFPQADDLQKVIDLVDAVAQGVTTQDELAERFEYDPRQADYYGNAAAFIGLVERSAKGFSSNRATQHFVRQSLSKRIEDIGGRLSMLPVFRETLEALAAEHVPSIDEIADRIRRETKLRGSTPPRRAQTVLSWARWLKDTTRGNR